MSATITGPSVPPIEPFRFWQSIRRRMRRPAVAPPGPSDSEATGRRSPLSHELDRATTDARSMLAGLPPVEPPFWRQRPPAPAACEEVDRER